MDDKSNENPGSKSFTENPTVMVSLFAAIATLIISAAQIWVAQINKDKEFELSTIQTAREIISEAGLQLGARQNDQIDLDARLGGITALRLLTTEKPPLEYYEAAVELLETYIRFNLPSRKQDTLGVTIDRHNSRPVDIVAALVALQRIRKATNGEILVELKGLDFSGMSLGYVDLEGFDLSFSDFRYSMLGPNLRKINFNHADLSDVAIWNADMSYSSFHKAKLGNAKFQNVVLNRTNIKEANPKNAAIFTVSGLTEEQASQFPNYKEYKP